MHRGLQFLVWTVLLTAVVLGSGCHSTWVSSGILYQDQGNWARAERMFRTALWYNEEEAAAHYYLAFNLSYRCKNEHLSNGEIDSVQIKLAEAFDHYMLAEKYDPEKWEYNEAAEKESEKRPVEDAIQSNYAFFFNEAVRYNQAQRTEDAITYFDLAYLADPRGEAGFNARISYIKLKINESQGDAAVVEEMLTLLDDLQPPSNEFQADLVGTKAQALRMVGRGAEATLLYEQLLRDNPTDIPLLQRVAQGRIDNGDRAGAGELLLQIVNLVENDQEMPAGQRFEHVYMACRNAYDAENYADCLTLGDRALGQAFAGEEKARVCRLQARSHYELEQYTDAVTKAEELLDLEPENPSAWQIYYLALFKAGRSDEATRARQRYTELSQGN